jgi:hypothetical protein
MGVRNKTKYCLNDSKKLAKNRFVLEVVKTILKNKRASYSELETIFLKGHQGSTGVLNRLDFIESKYANNDNKRHFIKNNEIMISADGIKFAVSTEWNFNNVLNIVNVAQKEGLDVKAK